MSIVGLRQGLLKVAKRYIKSAWFFPTILLIPLFLLTACGISGSSIGVYHRYLYGDTKDNNLLAGVPRPIRGDEWNSVTQITIGQDKNNFERINHNIGNGQDLSVLQDLPYRDWSAVLKPHNLAFFVLPLNNAFAFRWWFMLYSLIVSCYLFVIMLLPSKRLFASLIAIGFAFSPFIQWWYLYGTLGSLYWTLFIGVLLMVILKEKQRLMYTFWGLLLAYAIACFVLVFYPPFQIPCALAIAAFAIGFLIERFRKKPLKSMLMPLCVIFASVVVAGFIVIVYLYTRQNVIQAITNTAYPGSRVVESGGYNLIHPLSGQLSFQLLYPERAEYYVNRIASNQSEASSFILLIPFLFLPGMFLLLKRYRETREVDWPLFTTSVLFVLLLIRLYVPHTSLPFKFLLLGSVPHSRIMIGIGLLSMVYTVLIVKNLSSSKAALLKAKTKYLYSIATLVVCLCVNLYMQKKFPGFIGAPKAVLLSFPIPIIIYLILDKRFIAAATALCVFSIFSAGTVNPLYKDITTITEANLSQAIRHAAESDDGRWVTESIVYEQFPVMNGARSLTGVYAYPQLDMWQDSNNDSSLYNRYAHVYASIDRNKEKNITSSLSLSAPDTISINTEPCSSFLKEKGVKFILAESPITDSCVSLQQTVSYPLKTFYIYRIDYFL